MASSIAPAGTRGLSLSSAARSRGEHHLARRSAAERSPGPEGLLAARRRPAERPRISAAASSTSAFSP